MTTKLRTATQIRDVKLALAKCDCIRPRGEHVSVGEYVRAGGIGQDQSHVVKLPDVPSTTPCPFCERALAEIQIADGNSIGRVVVECAADPCDGEVAIVPPTHRVLACRPCKLVFTEPR